MRSLHVDRPLPRDEPRRAGCIALWRLKLRDERVSLLLGPENSANPRQIQ